MHFALALYTLFALAAGPESASAATLGELAKVRGLYFDTFSFTPLNVGPTGFKNAAAEFNMVILPVFFRIVEPERGVFDFSMPDAVADSAPIDSVFFVPQLAWNDINPSWLAQGGYSGSELKQILIDYVSTVVRHFESKYPGRVVAWEVAIEPLSWQGRAKCDQPADPSQPCGGFWNNIGLDDGRDQYEYIRVAAETARSITPYGKLVVTDFATEDLGERSEQFYQLIKQLKSEDVPIDAVAHEGHFMVGTGGPFMPVPPLETLVTNLNRLAALGVETMITSIDISIRDLELSPESLKLQADGYRTLLRACLTSSRCTTFGTWGIGDSGSWIPTDAGPGFKGWGSPLLFDREYLPKPAYRALVDEFLNH